MPDKSVAACRAEELFRSSQELFRSIHPTEYTFASCGQDHVKARAAHLPSVINDFGASEDFFSLSVDVLKMIRMIDSDQHPVFFGRVYLKEGKN